MHSFRAGEAVLDSLMVSNPYRSHHGSYFLSSFLSLQAGQDLKLCQPTICMSFMLRVEAGQSNTAFTVQLFLGMGWWCWTHVQVLGVVQAVP